MKKILLGIVASFFAMEVIAQVVVAGISPAALQRNFDFGIQADEGGWPGETDDGSWAMALDFNIDGTHIQAELVLVNDGSVGTNPTYGNLLSEEGCNPSTAGAYTGKIAVIRRNSCNFSLKMLNAQDAGAIGVIIVNREDVQTNMVAKDPATGILDGYGTQVTIPAVIISKTDGDQIIAEMANGPVTMFIGNKFGIFANDMGSDASSVILATQGSTPSILAQNTGELTFNPGIQVINYGVNDQTDVYVTATVDAPGTPNAYSQVVGPLTVLSKDTAAIFVGNPTTFPAFTLTTYPVGEYTLTYSISLGATTDDSPGDNEFSSNFYVTDDVFSYARFDTIANEPVVTSFPKNHTISYTTCIRFNDANASRAGVLGMNMALSVDTSIYDLQAQEVYLYAYQWDDTATTFSSTPTYDLLVNIAYASFNPTVSYTNGDQIFIPFVTPIVLEDNRNYLFCIEAQTEEPAFGYDGGMNYNANLSINDNVIFPIQIYNAGDLNPIWYGAGWNGNPAPSIGLKMFPAAELGITETSKLEGIVYPNPATSVVTISMNESGAANLTVTDVTGKIALQSALSLVNGKSEVNIAALEAGVYFFNVTLENGQTSQFNVVKK